MEDGIYYVDDRKFKRGHIKVKDSMVIDACENMAKKINKSVYHSLKDYKIIKIGNLTYLAKE